MASVRRRFLQSRSSPSSGRAPENRASPRPNGEQLPMLETHEDLLVRAAVESATEALQRELTATSLKLEAQAEATAKAHELIQELQQELKNLRLEAKERAAEHELLMQAVAESAREGARRDLAAAQEHIVQLQTALSTSCSEAQQACLENNRLAAQVAMTQQLLAVAETEVHELQRQLGEQLTLAENEARDAHQRYCGEVQALRAQLQAEKEEAVARLRVEKEEAIGRLQEENMAAVTQLLAEKEEAIVQLRAEKEEAVKLLQAENMAAVTQLLAEKEAAVTQLQKEKAEAVTQLLAQKEEAAAQQGAVDGVAPAEGGKEKDDDDAVMLRARCGALRRELESTQSQLASVTQAWEAAAQGRLAEKVAEAQSAAAAGRVKNDEEFWARNDEV
ncbi:hypothetical protein Vretifemale_16663, partial [Volvox reticuliferus]